MATVTIHNLVGLAVTGLIVAIFAAGLLAAAHVDPEKSAKDCLLSTVRRGVRVSERILTERGLKFAKARNAAFAVLGIILLVYGIWMQVKQ